ncbi:hypothetical protein LJC10_00715 [Selenomonadales bacterium OttesenSCG-928-I06]|nr:hypothetical protein [Selenomonadales bacterium OttesenSCG-928-I06]
MERNQSTIYRKLNGDCPITIEEAGMLVNILNLSVLESYEIFFNQTVANTLQIQGGDLN